MQEYKIARIVRLKENKEKTITNAFGKNKTESYVEIESWEDFYKRVEKTLNDLAMEGWTAVNISYNLPVAGSFLISHSVGITPTNYNAAEFVITMARER